MLRALVLLFLIFLKISKGGDACGEGLWRQLFFVD